MLPWEQMKVPKVLYFGYNKWNGQVFLVKSNEIRKLLLKFIIAFYPFFNKNMFIQQLISIQFGWPICPSFLVKDHCVDGDNGNWVSCCCSDSRICQVHTHTEISPGLSHSPDRKEVGDKSLGSKGHHVKQGWRCTFQDIRIITGNIIRDALQYMIHQKHKYKPLCFLCTREHTLQSPDAL